MAQRYTDHDQPEDTGRKGYVEAHEEWDGSGRPRIKIVHPFWSSESERLEYEHQVEETRGMLPSKRLEAIRQRYGNAGKRMSSGKQTRRERDANLAKLREQAGDPHSYPR